MLLSTIFLISCFILSALCISSLFKNYIFDFITSKNKIINMVVALSVISALVFAIIGFADCIDYENALGNLTIYADYAPETIEKIRRDVSEHKINMIVYTILGYVSLFIHKKMLKRI